MKPDKSCLHARIEKDVLDEFKKLIWQEGRSLQWVLDKFVKDYVKSRKGK